MPPATNPWDEYAEAFARWVAGRERAGLAGDVILVRLLEALGDVAGRGCSTPAAARASWRVSSPPVAPA